MKFTLKKLKKIFHSPSESLPSSVIAEQLLSPYNVSNDSSNEQLPALPEVIVPRPSTERRPSYAANNAGSADASLHLSRQTASEATQPALPSPETLQLGGNSYGALKQGDIFNSTRQVNIEDSNIYDIRGNMDVHYHINTGSVLKELANHAMLDATYDSSARDPPPRCDLHTRQSILRSIRNMLHDPDKKTKVTWLRGSAGVGKSAIMQTIAEVLKDENNTLLASMFFSRPNKRNDAQKVFATIAYQLAVNLPSYQKYLAHRVELDPSFLNKTIEIQFEEFITTPFTEGKFLGNHHGCVILLDGLDECENTAREQCRIIKLIGDFVSRYSTIPIQWVIASRPEQHLRDSFSKINTLLPTAFWKKEIPVDSKQSVRDVECYLRNQFTRIRDHYPDLKAGYERWPSESQLLAISRAASGLFVFASTIICFVDDNEDPTSRLKIVMSALKKQQNQEVNPFELLHVLYEHILSRITNLETAKLVLGCMMIRPHFDEYDMFAQPFWMCNILGLEQPVFYGPLRKLRSVLTFPEPECASREGVRFLHTSFSDYLADPNKSLTYSINADEIATHLWRRFMTILQQWTKAKSHDDIEFSWSIENLTKVIQTKGKDFIPKKEHLLQAVRWSWPFLLREHFANTPFRVLLSTEDLMEQLRQLDYSSKWTIPYTEWVTNNLVTCLETHVSLDHRKDLIYDVPFASLDSRQLLKSLYERYCAGGSDPFGALDKKLEQMSSEDFEKIDELVRTEYSDAGTVLDLLKDGGASGIRVTVLGAQPSRSRYLIRDTQKGTSLLSCPYVA